MWNVLIVDDEPLLIETIRTTVQWKKFDMKVVYCANDALSALDYLCTHPVDVVFTDIKMPRMGGIELLKRVHESCPHILFVMLSAWSDFNLVKESFQYGAIDYLLKIDLDDQTALEKLLHKIQDKHRNNLHLPPAEHSLRKYSLQFNLESASNCQVVALQTDKPYQCLNFTEHLRKQTSEIVVRSFHKLVYIFHFGKEDLRFLIQKIPQACLQNLRIGIGNCNNSPMESAWQAGIAAFYASYAKPLLYLYRENNYKDILNRLTDVTIAVDLLETKSLQELFDQLFYAAFLGFIPPLVLCEDVYQLFSGWMTESLEQVSHYQVAGDFVNTICSLDDLCEAVSNLLLALQKSHQEDEPILNQIKHYIFEHFSEPGLSVNSIARALGVSSRYVSSELFAHTGMHFKPFLNDLRIKRALTLMKSTNLRVGEICERTGYASVEHFSRVFSKQMGISPMMYMKKSRTQPEGGVES